jgi:hypothetical protein
MSAEYVERERRTIEAGEPRLSAEEYAWGFRVEGEPDRCKGLRYINKFERDENRNRARWESHLRN